MGNLVLSMLLIGFYQLAVTTSANVFIIGVLYDPTDGKAEDVSAVLSHLEDFYAHQPSNITFQLVPVHFPSQWTVCELINSSTVAFVAMGSCRFHRYLSLTMESHLPLPLVRVEMGTSCDLGTWNGGLFRGTTRYGMLPYVVADIMAFLSASQLMIVYSGQFVSVATVTAQFLSSMQMESAVMTLDDFVDPHLDFKAHMRAHSTFLNISIPIFLVVSKAEAESVLLQHEADAQYWLVFCEGQLNVSRPFQSSQFCIIPRFTALSTTDDQRLDGHTAEHALRKLYETFQQLLENSTVGSSHYQTGCGDYNVTVPTVTNQIMDYLSKYVLDKHGFLRIDHYDITMTSTEGIRPAGHWNNTSRLDLNHEVTSALTDSYTVTNTTLIIGTEVAPPFVFLDNGTWKGFCVNMIEELALRIGFKYVIVRSEDNLWGGTNPDGSWNGLVGMAIRKKIDMAIGPISVTAERETVVDFTKPYMESSAGLLMRRFEDTTAKMFRTLMPFTTNVWFTLAGLVILIGLLFGLINRFSPAKGTPEEVNSDRWIESLWDSAWVVFGSFMEQGAEKFPRGIAGRTVLGLWWVFTILITASYTASLAAFLTFSLAEVPINSIYDLAQQSDILPLVKNGTNLYALFKKNNRGQKQDTPTYKRIYEMMQQAPVVEKNEGGMEKVMSGPYALLTDREQLDLLQKEDCDSLVLGSENFNNNGLGFFVQKRDPLLQPLSYNLIKLMEAGLIDKWRRRWWSAKDVCRGAVSVSRVQSLKLDSTAGPFILYAGTSVLALLLLMSERAINKMWPFCKTMLAARPVEV